VSGQRVSQGAPLLQIDARRQQAAAEAARDEVRVIDQDPRPQLALARAARLQLHRDFLDAQGRGVGAQQVDQDLEPRAVQARRPRGRRPDFGTRWRSP